MDETLRKQILEQRYLYRGTNEIDFKYRKKDGFYTGRNTSTGYSEISTSRFLLQAMICGEARSRIVSYTRLDEDPKPLLMAIKTNNYIDVMKKGLESEEIEIHGFIDLKDVIEVRSVDQLVEVCPHLTGVELEFFKKYYQSLPTKG